MTELTQERVHELFDYDANTGVVTNRVSRSNAAAGAVAGSMDISGCRRLRVDYKLYLAHRIAWLFHYGAWPAGEIDHINGIRDDNRIINLRDVTHMENRRNSKRSVNNTSGVTGVSWYKKTGMWSSRIRVDGKWKFLGYFDDFNEAVKTRRSAEREHGFHLNHGRSE